MSSYTKMRLSDLKEEAKSAGVSVSALCKTLVRNKTNERFWQHIRDEDAQARAFGLMLQADMFLGNCIHYFMPSRDFCDWLVSCPKELGANQIYRACNILTNRFALHFPIGQGLRSFLGTFMGNSSNPNRPGIFLTSGHGACMWGSVILPVGGLSKPLEYLTDSSSAVIDQVRYASKLVAGFGLYASCFPGCIRHGIPSDLRKGKWDKTQKAKTVVISREVKSSGGITPHYRSGHFRLLNADRYTKKKGQVVFVHGCFVRGEARVVVRD